MSLNKLQQAELQQLAANHDLLKAEDVVAFARDPATALHHYKGFHWDDDEAAAQQHRLNIARQIIRVHVVRLSNSPDTIRAMVSLPSDRVNGGGYRETTKAMANPMMTAQMIETALAEIENVAQRFVFLPALKPVFDDLKTMIAKHRQAMIEQSKVAAG